jgi:hypothetical protein
MARMKVVNHDPEETLSGAALGPPHGLNAMGTCNAGSLAVF